eukprot:PhF_6_TR30432/c0_g1_i1/m.44668
MTSSVSREKYLSLESKFLSMHSTLRPHVLCTVSALTDNIVDVEGFRKSFLKVKSSALHTSDTAFDKSEDEVFRCNTSQKFMSTMEGLEKDKETNMHVWLSLPQDNVSVAPVNMLVTDLVALHRSFSETQKERCEHAEGLISTTQCLLSRVSYERDTIRSVKVIPFPSNVSNALTNLTGELRNVGLVPKSEERVLLQSQWQSNERTARNADEELFRSREDGEIALMEKWEETSLKSWSESLRCVVNQYSILESEKREAMKYEKQIAFHLEHTKAEFQKSHASVVLRLHELEKEKDLLDKNSGDILSDLFQKKQQVVATHTALETKIESNSKEREHILSEIERLTQALSAVGIERKDLVSQQIECVEKELKLRIETEKFRNFYDARQRVLSVNIEDCKKAEQAAVGLLKMCKEVTNHLGKYFQEKYPQLLEARLTQLDQSYYKTFTGYYESFSTSLRRINAFRRKLCEDLIGSEARYEICADILNPAAKKYVVGFADVKNKIAELDDQLHRLLEQRERACEMYKKTAAGRLRGTLGRKYVDPIETALIMDTEQREMSLHYYELIESELQSRKQTQMKNQIVPNPFGVES